MGKNYGTNCLLFLGIPKKTCKKGEQIIFSIPTGNFGNVYAGFVAKLMGLPIKKLVVSSNSNDVLTRFFFWLYGKDKNNFESKYGYTGIK